MIMKDEKNSNVFESALDVQQQLAALHASCSALENLCGSACSVSGNAPEQLLHKLEIVRHLWPCLRDLAVKTYLEFVELDEAYVKAHPEAFRKDEK